MTKKLSPHEKKNRRPASRACTFCHGKHLQCSDERPCKNCVKRNIAHECHDSQRKKAKYLKTAGPSSGGVTTTTTTTGSSATSSPSPPPRSGLKEEEVPRLIMTSPTRPNRGSHSAISPLQNQSNSSEHHQPSNRVAQAPILDTTNDVLNKILFDDHREHESSHTPVSNIQAHGLSDIRPNRPPSNPLSIFSSNYLNQEYLMLGDIILQSKPSSPSPSNTSASEYNANTVSPANFMNNIDLGNELYQAPKIKTLQKLKDSRPFISLGYDSNHNGVPDGTRTAKFTDNALTVPVPKASSLRSGHDSNPMSPLGRSVHTENNSQTYENAEQNQTPNQNQNQNLNQQTPSIKGVATQYATLKDQLSLPNPIMHKLTQSSSIPTEYVSPLITHHLYRGVQDIYSNNIMNFDYPQSYHSLTHFLKKRFSGNQLPDDQKQAKRKNLLIILKLIASYRPTFISAHKSLLKPLDLQFLEMSFQRSLIDYERLSHLNSSPTIIWRRTGEIVYMTDDLLSILGYDIADMLSKRTFIVELMHDDESIINYYKLFKSVAVGNLHSSIFTKCKLMKNPRKSAKDDSIHHNAEEQPRNVFDDEDSHKDYIEFCSVWTVKRDLFDLPMLIIGQFLPILPAGDGIRMY